MKRGMTLIEVLVSLTLLTAIISAAATWTTIAGNAAGVQSEPSRWHRAAQNVLDLIHDDLVTGDFESDTKQAREQRPPKVSVENDSLGISTRLLSAGRIALSRHYQLDIDMNVLTTKEQPSDSPRGRVLLTDVDEFACAIDETRTRLTVRITSNQHGSLSRSYALP
jgi:prepilin-type N-terminal cleavage/methylation domain-containing protein